LTNNRPYASEPVIVSQASDRTGLSLTVYNTNLALIKDSRNVSLPSGKSFLRFNRISDKIDTTSIRIQFPKLPDKVEVLDQQYLYDVVDPRKLLESYIGRKIILVERRKDSLEEKRTEAILLSTLQGNVYQIGDELYLGHPGEIVLPGLNHPLNLTPTLGWQLNSSEACMQEVQVAYLTSGLNWGANYLVVLDEEDQIKEIEAWVAVNNQSDMDYPDAVLTLIAGEPHTVTERRFARDMAAKKEVTVQAAAAPSVEERAFFEYHMYNVSGPISLKKNQIKQVPLIKAGAVPARKELIFRSPVIYGTRRQEEVQKQKALVELVIMNSKQAGLGIPLPAGTVSLYKIDQRNALRFIGQDRLQHIPKEAEVRLTVGRSFDVEMERIQMEFERLSPQVFQQSWEIQVKNYKDRDVEVKVIEPLSGDWKIAKSTLEWKKVSANAIEFNVPVKSGGVAVVQYTVVIKR